MHEWYFLKVVWKHTFSPGLKYLRVLKFILFHCDLILFVLICFDSSLTGDNTRNNHSHKWNFLCNVLIYLISCAAALFFFIFKLLFYSSSNTFFSNFIFVFLSEAFGWLKLYIDQHWLTDWKKKTVFSASACLQLCFSASRLPWLPVKRPILHVLNRCRIFTRHFALTVFRHKVGV